MKKLNATIFILIFSLMVAVAQPCRDRLLHQCKHGLLENKLVCELLHADPPDNANTLTEFLVEARSLLEPTRQDVICARLIGKPFISTLNVFEFFKEPVHGTGTAKTAFENREAQWWIRTQGMAKQQRELIKQLSYEISELQVHKDWQNITSHDFISITGRFVIDKVSFNHPDDVDVQVKLQDILLIETEHGRITVDAYLEQLYHFKSQLTRHWMTVGRVKIEDTLKQPTESIVVKELDLSGDGAKGFVYAGLEPMAGATVTIKETKPARGRSFDYITNERGYFESTWRFGQSPHGARYLITIEHPGYKPFQQQFVVDQR
jgi:hypothetical protein